jgi:hypothetical protein
MRLLDRSFSRRPDFDLPTYWRAQAQSIENLPSEKPVYYGFILSGYLSLKWLMPGRWGTYSRCKR